MLQRRKFSREFKLEAIKLVRERGVTLLQAARDLDIHQNVLRAWLKGAQPSASGSGQTVAAENAELVKLRRENAQLKMERDILKKATALFAREHQ